MAKKKSTNESFFFTVDDWCREYAFEINDHKWEFAPDHHAERDCLRIAGRLLTKTRRKIEAGEVHLLPSHVPRDKFSDEADKIGNTWVRERRLHASAFIPSDAYYSIVSSIAAEPFAQLRIRVKDLKRSKGHTESVALDHRVTELEPEEAATVADALVTINPDPW